MYRALYDYKSSLTDYLTFEQGDRFTLLDVVDEKLEGRGQTKKDWLLAQNGIGQIGYVPFNYIDKHDSTPTEVLKFIDGSIEAIHLQADSETGGVISHINRENLQRLLQHRHLYLESIKTKNVENEKRSSRLSKRQAPEPPVSIDAKPAIRSRRSSSGKRAPPPPPSRESSLGINGNPFETNSSTIPRTESLSIINSNVHCEQLTDVSVLQNETSSSPKVNDFMSLQMSPVVLDTNNLQIPANIGSELVEQIRNNTSLSFDKSKIALETVLGYIGFKIPALALTMDEIFKTSQTAKQSTADYGSRDARRLEVIFSELATCKDDSQQRSWALHEDESIIKEYLEELISILENAKQSISRRMVSKENYEFVQNLVEYYQMETRLSIRLLLLKSFGALCSLDKMVITILLFSVLPLELAQDIMNKSEEFQRLSYVTLVLSMIFSTGETVPSNLHDHLNNKFIEHIFDLIENPHSADHETEATDFLVNLVLAYNLHMVVVEDNLVMQYLSDKGTVKIFTEKVMLLLNRGDDPVNMFDHNSKSPNSVIKFFQDLYASGETANLLYTNDAMVLIDILVQQITDLPAGDPTRSAFLILTSSVVKNSDYGEHLHRSRELGDLLTRIKTEEVNTDSDIAIVVELLETYKHLFRN